jgi:hypothetical protein
MKYFWNKVLTADFLHKEYVVNKKNYPQIAKEIGCSEESVRRYLIKFNIPRRLCYISSTGLKRSEETKRKMSLASIGKPKSASHRLKCLENLKLRKEGFRKRAGKKIKKLWSSPEFRNKMLVIRKNQMTPEVINKISKQLEKREITSLEQKIIDICKEYKLPFKFVGKGSLYIRGRSPDFVDTVGKKLLIEVFYEYFKIKQYGSVKKYCSLRRALFRLDGYRTLFLANNSLRKLSKSQVANKIFNFTWR